MLYNGQHFYPVDSSEGERDTSVQTMSLRVMEQWNELPGSPVIGGYTIEYTIESNGIGCFTMQGHRFYVESHLDRLFFYLNELAELTCFPEDQWE